MLVRSKLNNIESTISKVLLENEISHEDYTIKINEEKSYRELKEIIRMMKSQRSDGKRNELIGHGKRISTDEIIKQNERINNNF